MLHTPHMGLALYNHWKSDGSPYRLSLPMRHLFTTLTLKHGYTVYYYPDRLHLIAVPAEDHTPYSETGWPIRADYGVGWALDIMPHADSRMPTPGQIAWQMISDRLAGHPATAPIKYINWTDDSNNCWHDKWQPNHVRTASNDRGHTHVSQRSDMDTSTLMLNYDPVAELLDIPKGDEMLYAYRENSNSTVWLSNGLHRRSTATWPQIQAMHGAGLIGTPASGVDSSGFVFLVPDGELDGYAGTVEVPGSGGNVNFPPYTMTFTGTGTSTPA